jgi:putative ABC transport system substrate-binding protein
MKRRDVLALLVAAAAGPVAWPAGVRSQRAPKMLSVGCVGIQPRDGPQYSSFLKRMAELGYQEGRNFTFEYVQTPSMEGYDTSFRELAARKVDVFLAVGNEPALRAARATAGTTPIAFLAIDFDPLAKGLVTSLSRPGGNLTGIVIHQLELAAKRVELMREIFPKSDTIGIVSDAASREQAETATQAAHKLGFAPRPIEVKGRPDYAEAFGAMDDAPGHPVVLPASPLVLRDRVEIAALLMQRRIPAIAAFREIAEAGVLVSYGVNLAAAFRDIAGVVDQIARGMRPADLPIEQATQFHLAVNLKSAAALELSLSNLFVARANEVFE